MHNYESFVKLNFFERIQNFREFSFILYNLNHSIKSWIVLKVFPFAHIFLNLIISQFFIFSIHHLLSQPQLNLSWVWHENDFNPPPPTANSMSSISQLLLKSKEINRWSDFYLNPTCNDCIVPEMVSPNPALLLWHGMACYMTGRR